MQDLMKGLAASTGQSDDTVEEPFISGTFEYGGRAAAQRKVYLFANKAQDQGSLTDATVQFLGVFKTDKKVCSSHSPLHSRWCNSRQRESRQGSYAFLGCALLGQGGEGTTGRACIARMRQVPASCTHGRKL